MWIQDSQGDWYWVPEDYFRQEQPKTSFNPFPVLIILALLIFAGLIYFDYLREQGWERRQNTIPTFPVIPTQVQPLVLPQEVIPTAVPLIIIVTPTYDPTHNGYDNPIDPSWNNQVPLPTTPVNYWQKGAEFGPQPPSAYP